MKKSLGLHYLARKLCVLTAILLLSCGSETKTVIEKLEKPPMTLTSPAFKHGEVLPDTYTHSGWWGQPAVSPPLEWTNVPDGTSRFTLVLYDPETALAG